VPVLPVRHAREHHAIPNESLSVSMAARVSHHTLRGDNRRRCACCTTTCLHMQLCTPCRACQPCHHLHRWSTTQGACSHARHSKVPCLL
jgi:hypothetical protein